MIDYQSARYACESGLKYALASIEEIDVNCISRPNEPDFSDLFTMSDEEYKKMMQQWAIEMAMQLDANGLSKSNFHTDYMDLSRSDSNDSNGMSSRMDPSSYDINDVNANSTSLDMNEPNEIYIRGPYGPAWPYITKPIEIEFGKAKVTIEIIDENAKIPLIWGMSTDANSKDESKAAIVTFCEWMQMLQSDIDPLLSELDKMKDVKPFSIALKPVTVTSTQTADSNSSQAAATGRLARRISRTRSRGRVREKIVEQTRPESGHTLDFAKILHSPMIDLETLAKPVNEDETRSESALKYISLWGTQKVNVNSAPRQVLEAAFTFGGDAPEIAQKIIDERKIKPFASNDDFNKRLVSFFGSISKCEPYITTQSDCFSIRVKATSGVARVCATAAVKKEQSKVQKIGIIIE
ncbi:MAG: hypothetical protein A2Y10_02090 [Planctomycetes bacterium GWF2_41_51]|nr:MAG: hypothetical protein A2Y10_02090 [Planctomycetes bacterium GWF2_41_51]